MDRRGFISAGVLGLGGLALGKLLSLPPAEPVLTAGAFELQGTEFVPTGVYKPCEPMPVVDVRSEIEELGLAYCRSLPFNSDWYYARSDGKLAFWSCITTPRYVIRLADFTRNNTQNIYDEIRQVVPELWRSTRPAVLKAREEGWPFVAITEPTIQTKSITDAKTGEPIGQEWWAFFHLTKDVPWPHPLETDPVSEMVAGSTWAAGKLSKMTEADREQALQALFQQNPTFHALVKHALEGKQIKAAGQWIVIMPTEGLLAERIDLIHA